MNEKTNQKWPKRYRAEHIEPGIISYEDIDAGKVFVSKEALDRMRKSFIGKPVVNEIHKDLTPEEAFKLSKEDPESWADGVVTEIGHLDSGWDYADAMIWDEDTKHNIDIKKYAISCAYIVTETKGPGTYHGIAYDEEVVDGYYTHLAIVPNPRYERSKIYENSKGGGLNVIFKLIGKKNKKENAIDDKEKKKEEKENAIDIQNATVETENGEKVPMEEMVAAYKKQQKDNASQTMNMDDEVEVDGKKVKVKTLYDAYKSSKKNADTEKPDDKDDDKENQSQEEDNKEKKPKENTKNDDFLKLQNAARKNENNMVINVKTRSERLAAGNQKYGKIKEANS